MSVADKILSKTLKIQNGKLLRNVEDISKIKKIISILEKKGYIGKFVINTKIYSEKEKLVEHDILKYIIHSGEYTESMAFDVNKLSLDMAISLSSCGVFAYDLLPHNFTFYSGNWFLYDFDSFKLSAQKSITQIRGFFKIVFSNYEILRLIERKKLSYFYLTRYRIEDIIKLIPLHRWLYLFLNQSICNILYAFRCYKLCYSYLQKLFISYSSSHKRKYYKFVNDDKFDYLNSILSKFDVNSAFCVGELSARWAISNELSDNNLSKLVYIDDYEICDDYYNLVVQNSYKNIVPAVIYPLVNDEEIPKNLLFRALYDTYAQERFYSDCVVALDVCDVDMRNLINNLSVFSSNILVLSKICCNQNDIDYLKTIFCEVELCSEFVVSRLKKSVQVPLSNKPYKDGNRGPDAHRQTWEVLKLLKSK